MMSTTSGSHLRELLSLSATLHHTKSAWPAHVTTHTSIKSVRFKPCISEYIVDSSIRVSDVEKHIYNSLDEVRERISSPRYNW